jgi:hypothetical protein
VVGKVVETREDSVALALHEDQVLFGMPGDKRDIIDCEGKVSHKHSIFSTRKVKGGTSSTLTAYRIALGSESAQSRAIFVPAMFADSLVRISRITCTDTVIYVLLMEQRDIVAVLAYDLQGDRKNAWRIRIPDRTVSDRNPERVIDFADHADRFDVVIGEYQDHGGGRGATVATLGKRYVIHAPKR